LPLTPRFTRHARFHFIFASRRLPPPPGCRQPLPHFDYFHHYYFDIDYLLIRHISSISDASDIFIFHWLIIISFTLRFRIGLFSSSIIITLDSIFAIDY
jgi:hypothetical protein